MKKNNLMNVWKCGFGKTLYSLKILLKTDCEIKAVKEKVRSEAECFTVGPDQALVTTLIRRGVLDYKWSSQ